MRVLPMRPGGRRYPRIPRPLRTPPPAPATVTSISTPRRQAPPRVPPATPTPVADTGSALPTLKQDRYLLEAILTQAQATSRILDFGAGSGRFAIALRQLHLDVTALEPDVAKHDSFIANGIPVGNVADALPASSFDLVYAVNGLERIAEDAEALRQLHACLRPEGTLLLYVPAFMLLHTRRGTHRGPQCRYTRRRLSDAVNRAGLRVERIRYVDSLGFFAALLFKLFGRGSSTEHRAARAFYDRVIFPLSTWLDFVVRPWLGRNLLLIARRDELR